MVHHQLWQLFHAVHGHVGEVQEGVRQGDPMATILINEHVRAHKAADKNIAIATEGTVIMGAPVGTDEYMTSTR
jgi:hypothetical protein